MHIKTAVRYHLTPVRMAIQINPQTTRAGEAVGKGEASGTVAGNADWGSHRGKQCGIASKFKNSTAFLTQRFHCWEDI